MISLKGHMHNIFGVKKHFHRNNQLGSTSMTLLASYSVRVLSSVYNKENAQNQPCHGWLNSKCVVLTPKISSQCPASGVCQCPSWGLYQNVGQEMSVCFTLYHMADLSGLITIMNYIIKFSILVKCQIVNQSILRLRYTFGLPQDVSVSTMQCSLLSHAFRPSRFSITNELSAKHNNYSCLLFFTRLYQLIVFFIVTSRDISVKASKVRLSIYGHHVNEITQYTIFLGNDKLKWYSQVKHFGHTFNCCINFSADVTYRKGQFIGCIITQFGFAHPVCKLKLLITHGYSFYGSS